MHAHMHARKDATLLHAHMHARTHAHMHAHMHARSHAHMHAHMHMADPRGVKLKLMQHRSSIQYAKRSADKQAVRGSERERERERESESERGENKPTARRPTERKKWSA